MLNFINIDFIGSNNPWKKRGEHSNVSFLFNAEGVCSHVEDGENLQMVE